MPFICPPRKPRDETSRKLSALAGAASLALRDRNSVDPARCPQVVQRSQPAMVRSWTRAGAGLYISKLTRQFKDGNLNVRSPCSGAATFEELGRALGSARWQTKKMKEQGLLRETTRQMIERVLGRT